MNSYACKHVPADHKLLLIQAFPGLIAIRPAGGTTLEVAFAGDERQVVELDPWIGTVRPLQPLRDPAVFATARVAFGGAGVAWGEVVGEDGEGTLDMDGEQLWRMAGEQAGQVMPVAEFRAWLTRHGLSPAEAAGGCWGSAAGPWPATRRVW